MLIYKLVCLNNKSRDKKEETTRCCQSGRGLGLLSIWFWIRFRDSYVLKKYHWEGFSLKYLTILREINFLPVK